MQNQNNITIAFVFLVGLIGGYMIAQHVGHAAENHKASHEAPKVEEHHSDMPHEAMVDIHAE